MSAGAGAAGAAAAAIARAVKASGVIVELEPREFRKILERASDPVVVVTPPSGWGKKRRYLTSYRGLAFHTKTSESIPLGRAGVVACRKIWTP